MSDLLSCGEVQKVLKELPKEQSELVKDIVPAHITVSGIQRVLQILLAERVSIRDLATVLEGIADGLRPAIRRCWRSTSVRACRASFVPSTQAPHALFAHYRAHRQVGAGLRRIRGRPGRRTQSRHATVEADGVHQSGPRKIRASGAPGRSTGTCDFARHSTIRARHRRAFPRANERVGADRNSPTGEAEDRCEHLAQPFDAARPPSRVIQGSVMNVSSLTAVTYL